MGCLAALFVLAMPRFVMVVLWIFTNYLSRAYDGWLLPLIGFFILPTTTLTYAVAENGSKGEGVRGFGLVLVIVGVLLDLGIWGGGRGAFEKTRSLKEAPGPIMGSMPTLTPRTIQRTYLVLLLGNTLAASLIWGINTIFLLDAGLSNLEAFSANAFFTAGMVLFEVPTGIVADTAGRRMSFLVGTVTLSLSTLLYVLLWQINAPFPLWAIVSVLIGLGFTFFSGATEAWLVDALTATGFKGEMETVFGRGQIVTGIAMLLGSVAGGFIAARTSLGVPFVLRGAILIVMFVVAFKLMHDIGFTPRKGGKLSAEIRALTSATVEHGWKVPAVKWLMVEGIFVGGVGIYAFYALQPYLLELYGDPSAYQVAGLVAAIVAGAQILGGVAAPRIRRLFHRRTSALILTATVSVATLGLMGFIDNFYVVVGLIVVWALLSSASLPIRQTYINGLIPSSEHASILSFDSMMASLGGVGIQPALGRSADVWGYGPSYAIGAAISAISIPFIMLSRKENAPADTIEITEADVDPSAGLNTNPLDPGFITQRD